MNTDIIVRLTKSDADLLIPIMEAEIKRTEYVFERSGTKQRMVLSAKIVRMKRALDALKGLKL